MKHASRCCSLNLLSPHRTISNTMGGLDAGYPTTFYVTRCYCQSKILPIGKERAGCPRTTLLLSFLYSAIHREEGSACARSESTPERRNTDTPLLPMPGRKIALGGYLGDNLCFIWMSNSCSVGHYPRRICLHFVGTHIWLAFDVVELREYQSIVLIRGL